MDVSERTSTSTRPGGRPNVSTSATTAPGDETPDLACTWAAPATTVIIPGWAARRPGLLAEVRSQWARTRHEAHLRAVARDDLTPVSLSSTPGAGVPWAAIEHSLTSVIGLLSPAPDPDRPHQVPVWEIERATGLIRRGEIAAAAPPVFHTTDVQADGGSSLPEGGNHAGLRYQSLVAIPLDDPAVDNTVASALGGPPQDAVSWLTLTPAAGSTPHWNGVSTRRLTWSGHGRTLRESRAGARIEGLERVVSGFQSEGAVTWASAADLPGRVLTPDDFPSFPDSFFREHGARFDRQELHEWVRIRSLSTGEPVWIAREQVYYAEPPRTHRWALGTSSGCATGSSSREAAVFGLLELVERDTFINSWYGRVPAVPVDVASVPGVGSGYLERVDLLGWSCELGLLRTPLGLPVFVAAVATGRTRSVGAACHPDAAEAARRALTEAITYAPERHDTAAAHLEHAERIRFDPDEVKEIDDHSLTIVAGGHTDYEELCGVGTPLELQDARLRHCGNWDSTANLGPRALLDRMVAELGATGVEVFAHRLTSSPQRNIGIETVMAIAPNLTPLDFGWRMQRALDSPRPAAFAFEILGEGPPPPRLLPHPFS